MATIQHELHISSTKAEVLQALGSADGIAHWWTRTTDGGGDLGDALAFRFGEHVTRARVTAKDADRVEWTIEDSNPDWVGTRVGFELAQVPRGEGDAASDKVRVRFTHSDWREQNDFFGHCSMKWATFLLSLRDHVERGQGRPFPDDVAI